MLINRALVLPALLATLLAGLVLGGCSTQPDIQDRRVIVADARSAELQFERTFAGLDRQIARSGGYVVFPDMAQWGIIFSGGRYGRGVVRDSTGVQDGWAAINTASFGLQAGVQGFKMLVVFEDDATFADFKDGDLSGNASSVAVAGELGGSGTVPFRNGVAVYQMANTGLLAGVNIGLDIMRYHPLGEWENWE